MVRCRLPPLYRPLIAALLCSLVHGSSFACALPQRWRAQRVRGRRSAKRAHACRVRAACVRNSCMAHMRALHNARRHGCCAAYVAPGLLLARRWDKRCVARAPFIIKQTTRDARCGVSCCVRTVRFAPFYGSTQHARARLVERFAAPPRAAASIPPWRAVLVTLRWRVNAERAPRSLMVPTLALPHRSATFA